MPKHIRRGTTKATIEHAIDSVAPGAAEQLEGKAKVAIGKGEQRLGELTGRPDIASAGRRLEVEGAVEEIVGGAKAATADAAAHLKAAGERISETLKGEPKEENTHER